MSRSSGVSSVVKIVGVAAALALAAACGGSSSKAEPPTTTAAKPTRRVGSSTPAPTTTTPRVVPGVLTAHIELPSSTLVAGATEIGTLVFTNGTGGPLHLTTGGTTGCKPGWTVILTSNQLPQEAAFPADCKSGSMLVPAGVSRRTFSLRSDYQTCSETGSPQGALTPVCVKNAKGVDTSPPLPPGNYRATFFSNVSSFIPVESVPVRVVASE